MSVSREERIKAEAYRKWVDEGRPEGQHERHWHEAAEAVNGEGQAKAQAKPRRTAKPAAEIVPASAEAPKKTRTRAATKPAAEPVVEAKPKRAKATKPA